MSLKGGGMHFPINRMPGGLFLFQLWKKWNERGTKGNTKLTLATKKKSTKNFGIAPILIDYKEEFETPHTEAQGQPRPLK